MLLVEAWDLYESEVNMIGTYFKKDNLQELLESVHSRMRGGGVMT